MGRQSFFPVFFDWNIKTCPKEKKINEWGTNLSIRKKSEICNKTWTWLKMVYKSLKTVRDIDWICFFFFINNKIFYPIYLTLNAQDALLLDLLTISVNK